MDDNRVPCVYCRQAANTRDHILPKAWGGAAMWLDHNRVWNTVPACFACNQLRAICGHCPGAMAALRAVAGNEEGHRFHIQIAQLWGWRGARMQALTAARLGFDLDDNIETVFPLLPGYPVASEIRPAWAVPPGPVAPVKKTKADNGGYTLIFRQPEGETSR